jgi:predicted RNA-binding protein associated with RNAse of E/G family
VSARPEAAAAWASGDAVLLREIHRGRVWAARPATIVSDEPGLVALYLEPGIRWMRPVAASSGVPLRMPAPDWQLAEAIADGSRVLYLIQPGAAHAVHLRWLPPDWRFEGWYVNLQEPLRRSPDGFDYMDHMLDIVVDPDLSWRWKDEDELTEAVASGLVSEGWAERVRSEGRRVVRRIEGRQPPFTEPWDRWEPDPAWRTPTLPDG